MNFRYIKLKLVESMLDYTLANMHKIFLICFPFDQTLLVDVNHNIVYSNKNERSI